MIQWKEFKVDPYGFFEIDHSPLMENVSSSFIVEGGNVSSSFLIQ